MYLVAELHPDPSGELMMLCENSYMAEGGYPLPLTPLVTPLQHSYYLFSKCWHACIFLKAVEKSKILLYEQKVLSDLQS